MRTMVRSVETICRRIINGNRSVWVAVLLVIVALLTMPPAEAKQGQQGSQKKGAQRQGRHKINLSKLQKRLQLTDQQVQQLRRIFAAVRKKRQAIMAKYEGLSPEERRKDPNFRADMKRLRKWRQEKVASILTADQLEKWKKFQKQRQNRMSNRKGDRKGKGKGRNQQRY